MSDIVALQETLYTSRNPTRRWLHTSRRNLVIEAIQTAPVFRSDRALEVGPGSGVYLPSLSRRFKSVVAVEIDKAHVTHLKKSTRGLKNLDIIEGDLRLQQWPEQFDLALCSEVIEHVADAQSFMVGLGKAIKPGGILILSTPQPWSLMELTASIALSPAIIGLTRLVYREPVLPTGHIGVMSRHAIIRMLRNHDFEILSSNFFGLYVPLLAEFGGQYAVSILRTLENTLQRYGPWSLLWTQLHIARKR